MQCIPVILCGGSGTRLWPLSRSSYPKQFIEFEAGTSLFAEAVDRGVQATGGRQQAVIVCNEAYRFYAADQLEGRGVQADILLEPEGRNTAPAIALAALHILEQEDALMLVLPSDHRIRDVAAFVQAVEQARVSAENGHIVTFGIVPDRPETGYGYIQQGDPLPEQGSFRVARFVEKPPLGEARAMLADGRFLWNSGMFVIGAAHYLEELERFEPDIARSCREAWAHRTRDGAFLRPAREAFARAPSISVDYAVLERTQNASVCRLQADWNDMGTWESFYQTAERDGQDNAVHGDVILENVRNSYVYSRNRLVAAMDVEDVDIIETGDAVLVASRRSHQKVKELVDRMKAEQRAEVHSNPVVYRPWGNFEALTRGDRFQVKRIVVNPGAQLSSQMHYHRAEHWIVVSGTAEVTIDGNVTLITANQSTYIPTGTRHRLRNPGRIPLVIIEVQSGDYLGEDDIVRFDDIYGRKASDSTD